ncbi:Fc.00g055350.m01.CDS01 [Cosmosporella sp. VM-42]
MPNNNVSGQGRRSRRYAAFNLVPSAGRGRSTNDLDSRLSDGGNDFPVAVAVSRDKILDSVNAHKRYIPPGENNNPILDLPELDCANQYCTSTEQVGHLPALCEREIDRLLQITQNPSEPLLFKYTSLLCHPSKGMYQKLSDAAKALSLGVLLSELDNSLLTSHHFPKLFDKKRHERLQAVLQNNVDDDPNCFRNADSNLCWELLDFVTGTIARLVTQAFQTEFLQQRMLAILAKLSTKLKILSLRPKTAAELCLNTSSEAASAERLQRFLVRSQPLSQETPDDDGLDRKQDSSGGMPNQRLPTSVEALQSVFEEGKQRKSVYFAENKLLRDDIFYLLGGFFANLQGSNPASGLPVDCFDMTSLVYRTGFDQFPVLLSQDRDTEILASSASDVVQISHTAFLMLGQTLKSIYEGPQPSITCTTHQECVPTVMQWDWYDEDRSNQRRFPVANSFELNSLTQVVSLAVLLVCTQPRTCRVLMGLFIAASSLNRAESLLESLPKKRFTAQVTLRTANFDQRYVRFSGDDAKPLSESLMTRSFLAPLSVSKRFSREEWEQMRAQDRQEILRKAAKKFNDLISDINSTKWTIDERAIIIQCRLYVYFWGLVCLILVLGGLAIGISVQNRIDGVDPFNFATFCWALAAFILLVVRSVRVENWPWRDFLRGRCVCRSVSELCSVTRLDAQNVLAYLLHNENSTILQTRGPFNKPFYRQENDGFSIDVRPELHTLLFSGIVLLKVSTNRGLGVVCLSVRKGTDYIPFIHSHREDEEEWNLASINYPNKTEKNDVILKRMHLDWNRVLGIYNIADRKFR